MIGSHTPQKRGVIVIGNQIPRLCRTISQMQRIGLFRKLETITFLVQIQCAVSTEPNGNVGILGIYGSVLVPDGDFRIGVGFLGVDAVTQCVNKDHRHRQLLLQNLVVGNRRGGGLRQNRQCADCHYGSGKYGKNAFHILLLMILAVLQ